MSLYLTGNYIFSSREKAKTAQKQNEIIIK